MADENKKEITVQALPKCVDESAKALILPAATETGSFLADLLYHVTGKVHLSAEKKRAQNEHDLQIFKEELAREISAKPSEYIAEPKQQVVGQAFEQIKNCLGEEEIRKMFEKLIANAADSRYQSLVHPSFPSMISQLSPLDAENLGLFRDNLDRCFPIVSCKYVLDTGGSINFFENCFLENPKMTSRSDLELQAASIESLNRQGIVRISYTKWLIDNKNYEKFDSAAPISYVRNIIEDSDLKSANSFLSHVKKVDFDKGMVELTPLGKSFVRVCFNT